MTFFILYKQLRRALIFKLVEFYCRLSCAVSVYLIIGGFCHDNMFCLNYLCAISYPEPYQHGMLNLSHRWVPPEIRLDEAAWGIYSLPHEPEVEVGKLT